MLEFQVRVVSLFARKLAVCRWNVFRRFFHVVTHAKCANNKKLQLTVAEFSFWNPAAGQLTEQKA